MKRRLLAITATLTILTLTSHAQIREVNMKLDGLFCAGCAFGIQKTVKKMAGVKAVKFRAEDAVVHIDIAEGKTIPVYDMENRLVKSGFPVGTISVTMTGEVVTMASVEAREFLLVAARLKAVVEAAQRDGVPLTDGEDALLLRTEEPDGLFRLLREPENPNDAFDRLSSLIGRSVALEGNVPLRKAASSETTKADATAESAPPFTSIFPTKIERVEEST